MKSRITTVVFLIPIFLFGQHRFNYLSIEDGLTENSITDIFQDSEGYMWFSTQDGISQYDGYHFMNYNISNNDSTSLSDNFLWGFQEDTLGFIWCCSRNGINRIDKKTGKCIRFYGNLNEGIGAANQISDLAIYKGELFASMNGDVYAIPIKLEYPQNNQVDKRFKLNTGVVSAFHVDKEENVIYFIQEGKVFNYTTEKAIIVPYLSKDRSSFFLGSSQKMNIIWFTSGKKLFYLNTKNQRVYPFYYDFKGATIYDLLTIKDELWVTTNTGVYVFYNDQLKHHVVKTKVNRNSLPSNFVSSIHSDNTGKIWLGTTGKGLAVHDPTAKQFKYLSTEVLGNDYAIRTIAQDKKNRLFLCGGKNNFVLQLDSSSLSGLEFAQNTVKSISDLKINGVENIDITQVSLGFNGDVLIGTNGNDILLLDQHLKLKKRIYLNREYTYKNTISDILVSTNNIWIATYYGVYVLDEDYNLKTSFLPYEKGLKTNYFLSVFEDKEHQIWLGSNTGIYKYQEEEDKFINYPYRKDNLKNSPGFNFVSGFTDFGDGFLWMATYGGGLSKMDKVTAQFQHFTKNDGLLNNVCNGLLADENDNIWLSTNKGISYFNTKTEEVINYTRADGLHFDEFILNSFYKNAKKELFFGTPLGIVTFNPDDIRGSRYQPPIVINAVDINYVNESYRVNNNQIELFPKDKAITIHFAGLNFNKSPKIRYKYKLQGYNKNWVETKRLLASYTSLPQGEYLFEVNVTNRNGIWNKFPKQLKIIVHPPFYKKGWFIVLMFLVLLAVVLLIIRYLFRKREEKHLQELRIQQEINQEKERISRDLHDNIGSQITYLIASIDQESYATKQFQPIFERLSDKARMVMTHLRQTIWVISKETISWTEFALKIRDYSLGVMSPLGINCDVQIEGEETRSMPALMVNHLFRIVQEANNNIVKHAKATEVKIKFDVQNKMMKLIILDNGVGLKDIKDYDDHFGLKNMRDRVLELKGEFKIDNRNNTTGTEILIKIPLLK